jgi:glucose-1-phosphate adenylyltransferase
LFTPSKFKKYNNEKSLISEGCIFECKEIKQSVIGIRSRVGEVIQNCYVMGNDFYQSINDMNADIKIINSYWRYQKVLY